MEATGATQEPSRGRDRGGAYSSRSRDLSFFLNALPRWYPGTWLPPGEMLTACSLLVALAVALFIWADPKRQALFRFPTYSLGFPLDQYYLLIPIGVAVLAWTIFHKVATRPGPIYPRWYALGLALACSAIAIGGLVDRIVFKEYRGSPWVHGASAAALMGVLVLAIRLIKIDPYSRLVQHVAAIAVVILLLGIVGARLVADYMINLETARVIASADTLHNLAEQIRNVTKYDWMSLNDNPDGAARQVEKLKTISLTSSLPDEWVWKAAGILGDQVRQQLIREAGGLAAAVTDSIRNVEGPRIAGTEYVADKSGSFQENADFHKIAPIAVAYHTQIRRMMLELDKSFSASPAKSVYEPQRSEYDEILARFRGNFSDYWVALAASIEDEGPLKPAEVAETKLDSAPLADFRNWKMLPWSTASSWRGQARQSKPAAGEPATVCGDDSVDYEGPAPAVQVKPDPDDAQTWYWRPRKYLYSRIDCYSYMVINDEPETVAQIQLLYRSEPDARTISDGKRPLQIDLYWKQSGGKPEPGALMSSLAGATKSIYNVQAKPLRKGDSVSRGFRVSVQPGAFDVLQPEPAKGPAATDLLHISIR